MTEHKFNREPLTAEEVKSLKSYGSFRALLIYNFVFVIPLFFGLILFSFFPFLPHATRGTGAQNPSSLLDYINLVGRGIFRAIVVSLFLIVTVAMIECIRTWIDIVSGIKKVGRFNVISVLEGENIKVLHLSGNKKVKVKAIDPLISNGVFQNVVANDTITLGKTRTNRLVSIAIVSEKARQPLT